MSYFDMVVQTKQTVSFGWFLQRVVESNFPLFITGVTGTGKTIMVNSTIERLKDDGIVTLLGMTFSAKTSSFAAQSSIE
jgi:dynein heavy chain